MYNARTSFNFFLQDVVDGLEARLNERVNLYVEESDFLEYPAVVLNYISQGDFHGPSRQPMMLIEVHTFVFKGNTRQALLLEQYLLRGIGFTGGNHNGIVKLYQKDYETSLTAPTTLSPMLLYRLPGEGFQPIDEKDTDVRHSRNLFMLLYRDHS